MPDQRQYAIEQERYRHDEALAFFGEYALFTFMWRIEDFLEDLVGRCPDCYIGYGDVADTYKQAALEKCPTCFGTTFDGGWKLQIVRLSTWDANEALDQEESARGQFDIQKATIQTVSDTRLHTGDYIFRGDGTRWKTAAVSTNHLREGFEMPTPIETPLGYNYGEVVKEDPSSVAYMIPPDETTLLTLDVTNVRYPKDWSALEQSRLVTP